MEILKPNGFQTFPTRLRPFRTEIIRIYRGTTDKIDEFFFFFFS